MTAEQRRYIKRVIDHSVRARLPEYDAACAGCGAPHFDPWTEEPHYTDGCRTCTDRRLGGAKRVRQAFSKQLLIFSERGIR
ncbi:MAG: hypothetical protein ACRDNE_01365 [Gaiellaceae bacterium]